MYILKNFPRMIFLFLPLTAMNTLNAQYVIQQTEYKIHVNPDMIPPNKNFNSSADEAKFFLNLPDSKLNKTGGEKATKTTLYIDGNNIASESNSPESGKVTTITDAKKGMFYLVSWKQKTVMTMSTKDAEDMQKQAQAAKEQAMKKMTPEMRKQIEAAEAQKKSGPKYTIKATGKEKDINGFNCKQFIIQHGDDVTMVWAADDNKGISKRLKNLSENMKSIFKSPDNEKDEWDLLPGKMPVEVRTYRSDMNDSYINVEEVKNIKHEQPPAGIFTPPGKAQGFTTHSMKDMMRQMQQSMKGGN